MDQATLVIALFLAYIAWQQWRTARNRLKFDTFQKRFAVYEAAKNLIYDALVGTHLTNEQLNIFQRDTSGAIFLLSSDISGYLEELFKNALELSQLWSQITDSPPAEERAIIAERQREIRLWFEEQREEIDRKFSRWLKLKH